MLESIYKIWKENFEIDKVSKITYIFNIFYIGNEIIKILWNKLLEWNKVIFCFSKSMKNIK